MFCVLDSLRILTIQTSVLAIFTTTRYDVIFEESSEFSLALNRIINATGAFPFIRLLPQGLKNRWTQWTTVQVRISFYWGRQYSGFAANPPRLTPGCSRQYLDICRCSPLPLALWKLCNLWSSSRCRPILSGRVQLKKIAIQSGLLQKEISCTSTRLLVGHLFCGSDFSLGGWALPTVATTKPIFVGATLVAIGATNYRRLKIQSPLKRLPHKSNAADKIFLADLHTVMA